MVFKKKKQNIPPAPAEGNEDYGNDVERVGEYDDENVIKPLQSVAKRGRPPVAPTPEPVEEEQSFELPFDETAFVNAATLKEMQSTLGIQYQNAIQILEETKANLKWLMEDNQAKASAMKVTMMNLDNLHHDINVVTSKFLSMVKESEDAS